MRYPVGAGRLGGRGNLAAMVAAERGLWGSARARLIRRWSLPGKRVLWGTLHPLGAWGPDLDAGK